MKIDKYYPTSHKIFFCSYFKEKNVDKHETDVGVDGDLTETLEEKLYV
jgi:hypothetical protein